MEELNHSEAYSRRRKFLLVLPLLVVPFVTLVFWVMGGGKKAIQSEAKASGLNTHLPVAAIQKDSARDKLGFYQAADADSARRLEQVRMDPYRRDTAINHPNNAAISVGSQRAGSRVDVGEKNISEKIAVIQRQINASSKPVTVREKNYQSSQPSLAIHETSVPKTSDPELEALNGMLDKIQDIQHPERTKEKLSQKRGVALDVFAGQSEEETYFGTRDTLKAKKHFYDDRKNNQVSENGITAIVPGDQIIQDGAVVKLRLTSDIIINQTTVPIGTLVYGVASIENERLMVHIGSIRRGIGLLPVSLTVFDMDGLEGIYVPGSISREVAKQTADQSLQSVGIAGVGLSLKMQAATAGIGAAKSLFSKKVKQVRITITAGYRVLLRDNKINN